MFLSLKFFGEAKCLCLPSPSGKSFTIQTFSSMYVTLTDSVTNANSMVLIQIFESVILHHCCQSFFKFSALIFAFSLK